MTSDRSAYSGTRRRATEKVRDEMERGVSAGRITAGQKQEVWKGLGERALRMTNIEVKEGSTITEPTWEDVEAHSESVGLIMGLRSGDALWGYHTRELGRGV